MAAKKVILPVLSLVLLFAGIVGCGVLEPGTGAMELVPQGANLIASVDIAKVINDADIKDAYNTMQKEPGQPPTFEQALDEVVVQTGIDLRDFSRAVIFADISTMGQADYMAVIAEGAFDRQQLISDIQLKTGETFTTSDHRGYRIYSAESEDISIAFLSDSRLVFGTMEAVRHTIDVSEGDRAAVSGVIVDTYNGMGEALVKVAVELPEQALGSFPEQAMPDDFPISLDLFTDIDVLGFALNKKAETVTLKINAHFVSAGSARDARDAIDGLISLFIGMIEDPQLKNILGVVVVSETDSNVIITFHATLSELEQLAETFQP